MKIYTKIGDKGFTTLWKKCLMTKAPKTHSRIIALGAIDELNSVLGAVAAFSVLKRVKKIIKDIQNDLFIIQAEIAGANKKINPDKTKKLEKIIDKLTPKLKLGKFIIPGGTKTGSLLYLSRAVCRRGEIDMVKLSQKEKINPEILKYINRLSDFLYILGRWENRKIKEKNPTY
jgi:cob(I)alamin adenosyltransferase